jgi:thiol-disulfide isomerase/thioredoxin
MEEWASMRRSIHEALVATLGANDPRTLAAAADLVEALGGIPRFAEAETLARKNIEDRTRILGPEHEQTLESGGQLAWLEVMRGRPEEAEKEAGTLLATCRRLFGDDHELSKLARSEMAAALIVQGKLDKARDLYGNRQVPDDLEPQLVYQGNPTAPRSGTQLFVYWETWCPFSQRTVPSLEAVHLRFRDVDVVGLTAARPPSNDEKVVQFLTNNNVTYPVVRVGAAVRTALEVQGTPWLVLSRDGWILWQSSMDAPASLVMNLLEGIARGHMS